MNENLVIEALHQSAIALEKQDKQAAINSLTKITSDVNAFSQAAAASEKETALLQTATTKEISELIKKQGKAHAELEQAKKELAQTYSNITVIKVAIEGFNRDIDSKNKELNDANGELRRQQAKMDDLNDTSFLAILASIGQLGLDRAIKGLTILIDGVVEKINNLNNTIGRLRKEVDDLKQKLAEEDRKASAQNTIVAQKNRKVNELNFFELKLHNQEVIVRKRLVYFTEVNLFYIKLQNLLKNVSNKIADVNDIVDSLDDHTPTIASFDPAQTELISLKQAILQFSEAIKNKDSMTALGSMFNPDAAYLITNEWLGSTNYLAIDVANSAQNKVIIAGRQSKGNLWMIKGVGNGLFKIINKTYPDQKSLDIITEIVPITPPVDFIPKPVKPWGKPGIPPPFISEETIAKPTIQHNPNPLVVLAGNNNDKSQLWKIEDEFGYFRLICVQTGDDKSFDVGNEGGTLKMRLTPTSPMAASQQWKFTEVR